MPLFAFMETQLSLEKSVKHSGWLRTLTPDLWIVFWGPYIWGFGGPPVRTVETNLTGTVPGNWDLFHLKISQKGHFL